MIKKVSLLIDKRIGEELKKNCEDDVHQGIVNALIVHNYITGMGLTGLMIESDIISPIMDKNKNFYKYFERGCNENGWLTIALERSSRIASSIYMDSRESRPHTIILSMSLFASCKKNSTYMMDIFFHGSIASIVHP